MSISSAARRQPSTAVMLSLCCTGLGHIYCGRLVTGLVLFLVALACLPLAAAVAALASSTVAFLGYLAAVLALVGVSLYAAVDAARAARLAPAPYEPKEYNNGLVYALFILVSVTNPVAQVQHIRANVLEAFVLPTASMAPNLVDGDRILVNKLTYQMRPVQRGDVVVFRVPSERGLNYVKRVIGLPGDKVAVRGGEVFVNGKKLERDRVPLSSLAELGDRVGGQVYQEANAGSRYLVMLGGGEGPAPDYAEREVPEGMLFVLGDNRDRSRDSRSFGFVPRGEVLGNVQYIYWPAANWRRFGLYQD